MKFKILLLLFLILFNCFCGSATAAYVQVQTDYIMCRDTSSDVNDLQWLETAVNNASLITHSGTVWYLNRTIQTYQSASLKIGGDPVNATKLILGPDVNIKYSSLFDTSNLEICGSPDAYGGEISGKISFHDVYVHDLNAIRIDYSDTYSVGDTYNVTIDNCTYGLKLTNFNNKKLYNIDSRNTVRSAVALYASSNASIHNITVYDAGDYLAPSTEVYGLVLNGCQDSTVHDVYVNGSGWSGVEVANDNAISYNITYSNMTIIHAGHNGIDLHGGTSGDGHNIYLQNVSCISSVADNYLFTGAFNISVLNCSSYDSNFSSTGGNGFKIGERAGNITLKNIYSEGDQLPVNCLGVDGVTITNLTTVDNVGVGVQLTDDTTLVTGTRNLIMLDSNISDGTADSALSFLIHNTTKSEIVNCRYGALSYLTSKWYDISFYYYADIVTKYDNGTAFSGNVTVYNNTYSSVDADGNQKTDFYLVDGRTALPTSGSNSIAIPEKFRSYNGTTTTVNSIQNTLIISDGTNNATLDGITPNSNWYRSNPDIPEYTITAIINDSANTHITGYAPSVDENEFTTGDSVTYQVWTSEDVDSISWAEDGVEVQNGGLTYTDTFTSDPVIVSFSATDSNGDISQTWDYYPLVAAFTANNTTGTAPITIQFTDGSQGSPTAWAWDFENDGTVDSTEQNPIHTYDTNGDYAINLTVSNDMYTDSNVKIDYIKLTNPYVAPVIITSALAAFFFMLARRRW